MGTETANMTSAAHNDHIANTTCDDYNMENMGTCVDCSNMESKTSFAGSQESKTFYGDSQENKRDSYYGLENMANDYSFFGRGNS